MILNCLKKLSLSDIIPHAHCIWTNTQLSPLQWYLLHIPRVPTAAGPSIPTAVTHGPHCSAQGSLLQVPRVHPAVPKSTYCTAPWSPLQCLRIPTAVPKGKGSPLQVTRVPPLLQ